MFQMGMGKRAQRGSRGGKAGDYVLLFGMQAHPVMPDCLRQLCEEARDMFMEVSGEAADEETEDAEPGDTDLREHFTTYMRPPGFAGVEPTIAFSADVSSFSREGLQPVKKKIWVRFGGIANSPVKNALKLAGIRRTAKGTHFNLFWTAALSRDSAWWKVRTPQRLESLAPRLLLDMSVWVAWLSAAHLLCYRC